MPKKLAIFTRTSFTLIALILLGLLMVRFSSVQPNTATLNLGENKDIKGVDDTEDYDASIVLNLTGDDKNTDIAESSQEVGKTTIKTESTTKSTTSDTTNSSTEEQAPVVNSTCPVSTLNCVPCSIKDGHWACRVEDGQTNGYLGWSCQNNNPGNIRPSSTAYPNCKSSASYDRVCIISNNGGPLPCGQRGNSSMGYYMVFSTYNDGKNALKAYIKGINAGQHAAYSGCGNCTLRYFLGKYSGNSTTYPDGIGAKLGVNPDTTNLNQIVPTRLDELVQAIQQQEGFFTK